MEIKHREMTPSVHPDAYVAPTAVLSGQVSVGAGSCVLHGAVLTADGGPVEVGANSVIMENAVLRGTPRHRLVVGDHVLAGPNSYLTGCQVDDEVFIATGAMVFNGARWAGQQRGAGRRGPHRLRGAAGDQDPDRLDRRRRSRPAVPAG